MSQPSGPSGPSDTGNGNCFQRMFEALINLNQTYSNSIVVDGEASSPLSEMQSFGYSQGQGWLSEILKEDINGKSGSDLSQGQIAYNQANSDVNNMAQVCGNLVSKATNDVNTDSSQSQEALQMCSTIVQGLAFFNNLLTQAFAA